MDAGLRFLFAQALGQLGLGALASEQLDELPEGAADLAEVVALRERLKAAPDATDGHTQRLARISATLDTLAGRGIDLREHLDAWATHDAAQDHYLTTDDAMVSRPKGSRDPLAWRWLTDERSRAGACVSDLIEQSKGAPLAPITVVGAAPPCTLLELLNLTDTGPHAYSPWIVLIEPNPISVLDALAWPGALALARSERALIFTGPEATRDYDTWARGRFDAEALGPVIVPTPLDSPISPDPRQLAERIRADQRSELNRAHERVSAAYAGRDRAWWLARFERALAPGTTEPLRVLIPTHRHSTYIQHASSDLRDAFERAGAQAQILVEPDDCTRLSNIAYQRAFERFEPDLVVLINYPRTSRPGAFTANVPFVCWIQDEMPHLFDERIGRAQGELDFLCGHTPPQLFERFAYPVQRALAVPVVINSAKFHPEPVAKDQRERFGCEIAFVSHHAETPSDQRDRIIDEIADERLSPVIRWIHERMVQLSPDAGARPFLNQLRRELPDAMRRFSADPDPDTIARIMSQCVCPMGERIFRHETLRWAVSIARRRNWRLKIFGRGWEHSPFARYAAPELAHGEPLRACYQSALVHLHASPSTAVHQRVMECAASGGLPLARLTHQMLNSMGAACVVNSRRTDPSIPVADLPGLMDWCAQSQRLGLGSPAAFNLSEEARERQTRLAPTGKLAWTARWLLGDLSEICFWSEDSLERLIDRAHARPLWRENLSASIRSRVLARATTDALSASLVRLVRDSLEHEREGAH